MKSLKLFKALPLLGYITFSKKYKLHLASKTKHDLYLWGNGRSEDSSDYENYKPHKINNFYDLEGKNISDKFQQIKTVEFGEYFTAIVNENGEAFIYVTPFLFGEDEDNMKNNIRENVLKVSNNLKIKEVKFTKEKLFLLTEDGDLYLYSLVVGPINHKGRYIRATDMPEELNVSSDLIKVSEIKKCKQIATGIDHIIILLQNGEVYGMGDDSFGQLGLDTFTEERMRQMRSYGNFLQRREKRPKKIPIENIIKVSCGDNHTLLLDKSNNVYGMGYNRYLQLSNDTLYREKLIGLNKPTPITIKSPEGGNTKIIDICCSSNCSFFMSETTFTGRKDDIYNKRYEIYSAGEGLKGTLGINLIKHINDIEILPDVSSLANSSSSKPIEFKKIVCGNQHCLLLLKNPRILYVWGNNEFGELGTKNRVFYESPLPMIEEFIIPNKILNVFAGKNCSGFVCKKNNDKQLKDLIVKDEEKYLQELTDRKKKREKVKDSKDNYNKHIDDVKNEQSSDKSIFQISKDFVRKYL